MSSKIFETFSSLSTIGYPLSELSDTDFSIGISPNNSTFSFLERSSPPFSPKIKCYLPSSETK